MNLQKGEHTREGREKNDAAAAADPRLRAEKGPGERGGEISEGEAALCSAGGGEERGPRQVHRSSGSGTGLCMG